MQNFNAVSPIMLLFHESRPEKKANHPITPCITFTSSCQLFCCFTNHALKKSSITPSRQPLGGTLKQIKKENTKIPVNIKKHNKQESEIKFNTTTMQKDIDNKIKVC